MTVLAESPFLHQFWGGFEMVISKKTDGVSDSHCPAACEGKPCPISRVRMQWKVYTASTFLINISWWCVTFICLPGISWL